MRHLITIAILSLGFTLGAGCAKLVGDDCSSALDCDPGQVCDRSLPGGYCTITPCEADGCPSEAACVDYPPFASYCMLRCGGDGDCRDDYVCVENLEGIKYCGVEDEQPQP
jgi:hypothetical protein